jgi:hypothetical protein
MNKVSNFTPVVSFASSRRMSNSPSRDSIQFGPVMDANYNNIMAIYNQTTAASLNNRGTQSSLYTGNNGFFPRLQRLIREPLVITPQDKWEKLYMFVSFILCIISIILISYSYFNDLQVVPKGSVDLTKLNSNEQEIIQSYTSMKDTTLYIQGALYAYIIWLSTWRIFKRTTV